ncbi:MAG: ATP-binding protein [Cyanobacteria bacterium J06639_1]
MNALPLAPIDVEHLCHLALDALGTSYRKSRVVLMVSGQPRSLISNANRLQTAIQAIALNALHYSEPDRMVRLCLIWKDWGVSLQVHDEGIGIPDEDLARAFEPGFRGSNVGSLPGRGMGLSAAKEAIAEVNAAIAICSLVNFGTTVTLDIPNHPQITIPVPSGAMASRQVARRLGSRF